MTERLEGRLEHLLARLVRAELFAMGARLGPDADPVAVMGEAGISEAYRGWTEETVRALRRERLLDGGPSGAGTSDADALWHEWDRGRDAWLEFPRLRGKVALLDRTVRALRSVLTGDTPAVEVLFPDSSLKLVEAVYRDNPEADAGREALAEQVLAHLTRRLREDPGATFRVIEIGAGTGATSSAVLRALRPLRDRMREYTYTDVSRAFLLHAEREFVPDHPYVTCRVFDVEAVPEEQGLETGGYDVAIAANVLHATRSIRDTLRQVKALLRPGGVLVANELVGNSLFAHLTFGLLEGWWRAEDPELRLPGCPGLAPETWARVLREEGLDPAPFPEVPGADAGQQLICAVSDGLVRRRTITNALADTTPAPVAPVPARAPVGVSVSKDTLKSRCVEYLTTLVSEALKRPAHKIDAAEPLQTYGIDSLVVVQLANRLRKTLGKVSSTVFFEHQTIDELAEHFAESRADALAEMFAAQEPAQPETVSAPQERTRETPPTGPAGSTLTPEPTTGSQAIAVIGLAGRYAGAEDVHQFWANIREGRNCVTEIPADRWDWRTYYRDAPGDPDAMYTKWGGFLTDIDTFDPLFFRISPAEAERMDPQERLFLETAYASVEDAGYTPATLSGTRRVGVFVGVMNGNYPSGANYWSIANRVSYSLDFHGPSLAVDTACSSSLTAIHLAVESLNNGSCECAVAGGVNLIVDPVHYARLTSMTMLSPDDRCKAFGDKADGFVDGEGVGAVVLKPLAKAVADGDTIYGVIKGSRLNAGGRTNGYTVPNLKAQRELVAESLKVAGCDARTVSYVEAHGTGTALGDPIEVAALAGAFRRHTPDNQFCAIGSVKTNIGHCESAAGIAGVTKVLLQMKHGELAPSLHARTPNPEIDFADTPFNVQQELAPWHRPNLTVDGEEREYPRIAGVSSFGAGGANAHLVIEEHRAYEPRDRTPGEAPAAASVFVLSARNEERLRLRADRLLTALRDGSLDDCDTADIAYTLQTGREAMKARLAFVARSRSELISALQLYIDGGEDPGLYRGSVQHDAPTTDVSRTEGEQPEAIEECLRSHRYAEVLELWVKGGAIPWSRLYDGRRPRRVPLPAYPFTKERYWLPRHADRPVAPPTVREPVEPQEPPLLLLPHWREAPATAPDAGVRWTDHLVILCGDGPTAPLRLVPEADGTRRVKVLQSSARSVDGRFEDYALRLTEELQELLRGGVTGRVLVQVVVPGVGPDACLSGLAGAVRTATLENPKLVGQLIEIGAESGRLAAVLEENASLPDDRHVRYEQGRRLVAAHREAGPARSGTAEPRWKPDGVYLITGGAGALGLLVAEEIVRREPGARLVLTGRSELDPHRLSAVEALKVQGARVHYRTVDVASRPDVEDLMTGLRSRFGRLDGIIHCAGVLSDGFLVSKTADDVRRVLAPKVRGLVNLDEASRALELDFFALFSSVSSAFGNVGQADYAAANGFMDAYAPYRNRLVASGQRSGHTLSVNWPLWRDGGMGVDEEAEEWLRKKTGTVALETKTAMRALDRGLAMGCDRLAVFAGSREKIMDYVNSAAGTRPRPERARAAAFDEDAVREKVVDRLKSQLATIAKLAGDSVDPYEPLESYGIDSVMITRWNRALEDGFDDLPKTLFFEQRTIAQAAGYLLAEYPAACRVWTGTDTPAVTPADGPSTDHRATSGPLTTRTVTVAPVETMPSVRPSPARRTEHVREPIAIIGMSGRYPQADSLKEYWENLEAGRDCITEIPGDRWELEGFYHPDPVEAVEQRKSYGKWGGFVNGFAEFDPLFFRMSPREAFGMDPQERLFIATSWEAMEDAGYTKEQLAKRYDRNVGVFAGITKTGFNLYGPELASGGRRGELHTSFASAANRVSYLLDLRGPSMPIDTMCSSSLVAVHEACENIHRGDCEMAIAGGVNLYLHPFNYVGLCSHHMLSVDGRCKSFGSSANGYVPGEGVGAVVLKRLSEAIADHDHIYAVIPATGVNHGGQTHGYTVPSPTAQRDLIRRTLDKAGIDARSVSYIEAHGTGTDLGDPIEVVGLTQAFRGDTQDNGFCAIGSVKSNIGHLEAAAGIAGLMKVVLQMQHGMLVPSLHAEQTNPNIRFEQTPFAVQRQLGEWRRPAAVRDGEATEGPRIAGVSSFGAGGANAHVLIQDYTGPAGPSRTRVTRERPALIVLSARNEEQLRARAVQLLEAVHEGAVTDDCLVDAAYTLQIGREEMEYRLATVVGGVAELETRLQAYVNGENAIEGLYQGQTKRHQDLRALLADDDIRPAVDAMLARGRYGKLLALWVIGLKLDWTELYADNLPYRMSMPTYPFANERYWVRDAAPGAGEATADRDARRPATEETAPVQAEPVSVTAEPDSAATPASSPHRPRIRLSTLPARSAPEPEPAQERPRPEAAAPAPVPAPALTLSSSPPRSLAAVAPEPPLVAPSVPEISAEQLEDELTSSLSEILVVKRSEIDHDKNFVDLGLDSIIGVEWIQELNKRYGLEITASRIYSYPTIREFTGFLREQVTAATAARGVSPDRQQDPGGEHSLRTLIERVRHGGVEIDVAGELFEGLVSRGAR
ncbi:SDR family NAD(P)-dependent oxidoreductase [Streptomyces hyaluromycini]|uniref:SDR family NAD(P)-dependent oxidoreductase n=1 Tax=Streptomyces hyaluromycini TaxID=1377993 RepID=UPI0011AE3942|nr:SDR family NAD(P)-dependent oxidoreductase [Streptomyces hyaluromycini]